ncbi:MAG: 3'-5' exonuclease, partial [Magnetococcales bacterium]|nr:3'-5' exonuclease [Magnetococcales bacterium]
NAGEWVPYFITELTGITNAMVRRAPPVARVMNEVADFVGDLPLVAHNASFDRKFWDAELAMIGRARQQGQEFACSMLAARRVYPNAPNHQLGTLASFCQLPAAGQAHRALADATVTSTLLLHMEAELIARFQISQLSHGLLRALQRAKKDNLAPCLERFMT